MIRRFASLPLFFIAITAFAQEQPSISPLVVADFGRPLFINRAAGVLNPFGISPNGSSSANSFGIGADFAFPEMLGRIGLVGRIEGIYSTGHFNFDASNYSVSGIDRKLLLEAGALWDVQPFAIRAGPWASARISTNVYENDPNGTLIASGDSIASAATHFGLSAGLVYDIPDFPLRPEINTHLDLTEIGEAEFSNSWSIGISLSYSFGSSVARGSSRSQLGDSERVETRSTPVVPSRVRFLVDRSEITRNVPLERVELRVKQYTMVDSANALPRIEQWMVESYHLPNISISCEVDRDAKGELRLIKENQSLGEFSISSSQSGGLTYDTTIDLEKSPAWQDALSRLNINEGNRIIAQLETIRSSGLDTALDTLFLPPVDTSRAVRTIVKKEFRFYLSDRFSEFEGGKVTLDLLLGRINSLLDSNVHITISEPLEPKSGANSELKRKVLAAIDEKLVIMREDESSKIRDGLLVILDY